MDTPGSRAWTEEEQKLFNEAYNLYLSSLFIFPNC